MKVIRLKRGRDRSTNKRHPWIFSGAIAQVEGQPDLGETVEVFDDAGAWLARAAYSPHSSIRARIWTWDREEIVDRDFFRRRIQKAVLERESLEGDPSTSAFREVFAESDGIPGLVVDRYNDLRVIQLLTAGAERWREQIISILIDLGDCEGIYERSDVRIRQKEGLPLRAEHVWGRKPADNEVITEYGLQFTVDIPGGQKTGFYLDQRENRRLLGSMLSGGEVLNCFAYTGGFTVAALTGGAERVLSIETSTAALKLARENVKRNHLPLDRCDWIEGDVFVELRKLRDRDRRFDVVILDPPRFAATARQSQRAARGYKDINLLAFKLLRQNGFLFTFSCSGGINPGLFQKIVAGAAIDAGVTVKITQWLDQPSDHPVSLFFPEGQYLKGLVCRVSSTS